jgi:hypothetical protein
VTPWLVLETLGLVEVPWLLQEAEAPVLPFRCVVPCVWCHVCGVMCVVSCVWCRVCGVVCVVSCVWCHVCGVMCVVSCGQHSRACVAWPLCGRRAPS